MRKKGQSAQLMAAPFEIEVTDETYEALEQRAQRDDTTVDALVTEAIENAIAGPWPIRYGDGALKVVLNFVHGQTVAFPLRIKDTTGISSVELREVAVADVRVLVRSQDETERRCRSIGHQLANVKTVGINGGFKIHGQCADCGEKVRLVLADDRSDVDALIAHEVATGTGTGMLEDDLAHVDSMRRRLEARQAEVQEALEELYRARLVLAARIERDLQP